MKKRLVCGVGINDADYRVTERKTVGYVDGKRKQKLVWICPFYQTWKSMLIRCYNQEFHIRQPTYTGCSVSKEWLTFSNFKTWMGKQDYEGKQLDKDLLVEGNKLYSPETCIFVSSRINTFMIECNSSRGDLPVGVYLNKKLLNTKSDLKRPYVAMVRKMSSKQVYLGCFSTPEEAHQAWLKAKLELAKELAAEILVEGGDPRVAKAIVGRYDNYKESS